MRSVRCVLGGIGWLCLPWALGAVLHSGGGPDGILWWRWPLLALWFALGGWLWRALGRDRRPLLPWLLLLPVVVGFFLVRPSNDRPWTEDQSRLPRATVDGTVVHFENVRNFRYQSPSEWTADWYDATYPLDELESSYYIVEHFAEPEAIAHTMVSFRFKGDRFLVFSVELHKEVGETYSPVRGLFRQYELHYVVADERDALQLRTSHRPSRVRLHPIEADPGRIRAYFLDLVKRVNGLAERPEFYNSLTSSCTTNLADHLEAVTEHRIRLDHRVYLPGYSSELAWELGLLGEATYADVLRRDGVSKERIELSRDREDFSLLVRGETPSNLGEGLDTEGD